MGALSWIKENVPGAAAVAEVASGAVDTATEYVAPAVDAATEYVAPAVGYIADATGLGDAAADPGPSVVGANVSGQEPGFRNTVDLLGNNLLGWGVDFAGKVAGTDLLKNIPGAAGVTSASNALGKVLSPAALISGTLGMVGDLGNLADPDPGQSSSDFDANSFLSNLAGAVGGGFGTAGAFGTTLGLSTAAAGAAASVGSVVGAGAAGLLGGHMLAKAGDGEYGRDENGRTTWDELASGCTAVERRINGEDNPDGFWGKAAGGTLAAVGGIGAGLVGGARAAKNGFLGLFD
jgi:hypothetical protein